MYVDWIIHFTNKAALKYTQKTKQGYRRFVYFFLLRFIKCTSQKLLRVKKYTQSGSHVDLAFNFFDVCLYSFFCHFLLALYCYDLKSLYDHSRLSFSEHISPTKKLAAAVCAVRASGIMLLSATRSLLIPCTFSSGETTAVLSVTGPILHVAV